MNKNEIKKVVLAYSGGLDTSIIIPWLKENYNNPEIIAVSGNVGQAGELDGLEEKAIKTGASKIYVEDLKEELVNDFIVPTIKAGAKYENEYLLADSCLVRNVNWIEGVVPSNNLRCQAKFRYRQPDVDVLIRFISEDEVEVKCFDKVRAITPGQMAVFYDNDVCLGGGVIEEVL